MRKYWTYEEICGNGINVDPLIWTLLCIIIIFVWREEFWNSELLSIKCDVFVSRSKVKYQSLEQLVQIQVLKSKIKMQSLRAANFEEFWWRYVKSRDTLNYGRRMQSETVPLNWSPLCNGPSVLLDCLQGHRGRDKTFLFCS